MPEKHQQRFASYAKRINHILYSQTETLRTHCFEVDLKSKVHDSDFGALQGADVCKILLDFAEPHCATFNELQLVEATDTECVEMLMKLVLLDDKLGTGGYFYMGFRIVVVGVNDWLPYLKKMATIITSQLDFCESLARVMCDASDMRLLRKVFDDQMIEVMFTPPAYGIYWLSPLHYSPLCDYTSGDGRTLFTFFKVLPADVFERLVRSADLIDNLLVISVIALGDGMPLDYDYQKLLICSRHVGATTPEAQTIKRWLRRARVKWSAALRKHNIQILCRLFQISEAELQLIHHTTD